MIAAILITGLVLAVAGVWWLVFTISCMASVRRACDVYVKEHEMVPVPPAGPSPHTRWDTKGSRERRHG